MRYAIPAAAAAMLLVSACQGSSQPTEASDAVREPVHETHFPGSAANDSAIQVPEDEPQETATEEPSDEHPGLLEFEGSGDQRVELDEAHSATGIATISYEGDGYFGVETLDANGEVQDYLSSSIDGSQEAVHLYNTADGYSTAALQVTGDGDWTITLEPVSEAREWDGGEIEGSGSDVLQATWDSLDDVGTVNMTHDGESNFIIWGYGGEFDELIVNEIGVYEGSYELTEVPTVVEVTADGNWTVTPE